MAIRLLVPGRVVDSTEVAYEDVYGVKVLVAVGAAEATRSGEQEQTVTLPASIRKEDVVLELDFGKGVRQWSALTQLQEDGVVAPEASRGGLIAELLCLNPARPPSHRMSSSAGG
jgi:hypothetical protein